MQNRPALTERSTPLDAYISSDLTRIRNETDLAFYRDRVNKKPNEKLTLARHAHFVPSPYVTVNLSSDMTFMTRS